MNHDIQSYLEGFRTSIEARMTALEREANQTHRNMLTGDAPNLPADAVITATCKTPAGAGAPGVYSIPSANRAASAFTVNSTIAAETSTFDWYWFSPSGGSGGVINGS